MCRTVFILVEAESNIDQTSSVQLSTYSWFSLKENNTSWSKKLLQFIFDLRKMGKFS
jgi:hypothetical protein